MVDALPAIATTALRKRFGDVTAVDSVEVAVRTGEIYALLGLNGAGKTTLIRMLLGMIRPTEGTVSIFGSNVHAAASRLWADVGYLVETVSAYPELTVTENLELIRRLRRLDHRGAVADVMDRLSLTPYAHRRARELSLGNAQRLGLAKAFLHRPRLLILDEPTNGLDPAGVADIRAMLRDLADRHHVTIFLSSHLLTEVARLADRIGFIHHGRLLQELDTTQISAHLHRRLLLSTRDLQAAHTVLQHAGHAVTTVDPVTLAVDSSTAVERPDDIAALLVHSGCPPTRLIVDTEDLETYFLRLIGTAETTR